MLRHNSLVLTVDGNGIQLAPNQGPLQNLTMEYNYVVGGGFTLRWGVDGGALRHNRFGRDAAFGPEAVYAGGKFDDIRDNRFADDGAVVPTGSMKTLATVTGMAVELPTPGGPATIPNSNCPATSVCARSGSGRWR
ncbi:MAG TPA: hypothetical protein PKA88_10885 [Polyangiaceae bacterium]|nr:hypothetical protein [Polyangiaceae bacterium]